MKKYILTILLVLAGIWAIAQTEVTIDFNDYGELQNLNGQHGWVVRTHHGNNGGRPLYTDYLGPRDMTSADETIAVFSKSSCTNCGDIATKSLTEYGFDFSTGGVIEIECDMWREWWGDYFGIGYDGDGDGFVLPPTQGNNEPTLPDPSSTATDGGIYFFSKDDLTSTANLAAGTGITLPTAAKTDVGTVVYTPATALTLDENGGTAPTGNLFFYVNETDATFTTTENQFSVRFKIARQNGGSWFADEIRYGLTTNHNGTSGGFNVIRRNDWIHIPIHLTDWEFRIEATPFVPIAGYPAMLLSSDALTAKFSTGGYIILKPFAQKNKDGSWRDFSDPEVTYVSVTWTNSDGTDVSGGDKIVKTPFTYDSANYCLTGELNNDLGSGTYKTTITVNLKLGPTGDQYDYSFSCNVILQK